MTALDPNIHISVEAVTPELLKQVQSLYADEPYKVALWDWQFKPRLGLTPVAVVARYDDEVIGFNGTMPILLATHDGHQVEAIWSCDFIVDAKYRGKGLGGAIKETLFRTVHKPIMSLGISDSAYPLLLKKGGKSPVNLSVYHRVVKPENIKSRIFRAYSLLRALPLQIMQRRIRHSIYIEELAHLPSATVIEYLWGLYGKSGATQVVRNYEYLHWRYVEYPFNKLPSGQSVHRFFSVARTGQSIAGLVVVRYSGQGALEVVDYLGCVDTDIIFAIVRQLQARFPHVSQIGWNSSATRLATALIACGFVRKSYASRFVVFDQESHHGWCLAAGDSDGDFLRDARDYFLQPERHQKRIDDDSEELNSALDVYGLFRKNRIYEDKSGLNFFVVESDNDFLLLGDAWKNLHERSSANSLFMSWAWQYAWWKVWGNNERWQLSIIVIYDEDTLLGIVPVYRYYKYGLVHYQFLGNAWGIQQSVRSEYIGPLFIRERETELTDAFERYFSHLGFAVLVIPDTTQDFFSKLPQLVVRQDKGYRVSTEGAFADYTSNLSAQTRLKLFGRRRQLIEKGIELILDKVSDAENERDNFFSDLNSFHLIRWGKPCFNRQAVIFHLGMLRLSEGFESRMSRLLIGDQLVSLSYNIDVNRVSYNLQSGYIEHFDKKTSLGTLHMGLEIERSFANKQIDAFDFLAGQGKVEDYKRHYRGSSVTFCTRTYYTNRLVWFIYSLMLNSKSAFKTLKGIWRSKKWKAL